MTKKQKAYLKDIIQDWYFKGISDGEIKTHDFEKAVDFYSIEIEKMSVKPLKRSEYLQRAKPTIIIGGERRKK